MMNAKHNPLIGPVLGLCLIVVGGLFLFGQVLHIGVFWPMFIILPGLALFAVATAGGRELAPIAIPASLVTGTGAILLYQSLTHHWTSWAYAWTLYPALLGAGIALMGRLKNDEAAIQLGRLLTIGGLGVFVLLGLFFETVLTHNLLTGLVWPLLLIVLGISLLLAGTRRNRLYR